MPPATPHRWRRWRRLLAVTAAVIAVVLAGTGVAAVRVYQAGLRSNVGELSFANRLRIPALLEPAPDATGRRVFDLTVAAGTREFFDGTTATTWGVNGPYLGPTLRARAGDQVLVNVTNELSETTTLHWHGMHLPAAMDGGPHQRIAPGTTWSPRWKIDQPAATLWYHAHPEGQTGEHVYRGVAGLFLVDDPVTHAGLPQRYGIDDIPVIVQDKRFGDDGQLDSSSPRFSPFGILGDEILVNGTHDPFLPVTTTRVRLRILNASTARTYNLGFTDNRPFAVVAGDASLLPQPAELRRVLLAPSERTEIVVDVTADDRVILRSYPNRVGGGRFPRRFAGGDDTFDLLRLVAAARLEPSPALPNRLPAPPAVEAAPHATRRTFTFNHASRISGHAFDIDRIDFTVAAGATEVWELRNGSDNQHVFHVHGTSFTIADYDGAPPPPQLTGWKDSVYLPPGTAATIVLRFREYADAERPYMFHCHLLAHEDHGMMGQFVVTDRLVPLSRGRGP